MQSLSIKIRQTQSRIGESSAVSSLRSWGPPSYPRKTKEHARAGSTLASNYPRTPHFPLLPRRGLCVWRVNGGLEISCSFWEIVIAFSGDSLLKAETYGAKGLGPLHRDP